MNLDIKQRIEQIESGEVPNGYIKKYKYVFPNTWNLVNLGSVTKRKSEKNKNRNDLKSYSINNQVGFIQQDEQFSEGSYQDVDKTNYKVVKPGEFAYNPARINIGSIGLQKEDADVIISSLYVCFGLDKSYSKTYFENWFKSYDFNKEITRNLEGSVREYLFYENFSNIKLTIPSLAEQEKIAEILMQCDKLIELYQNETDELQKLKKICLCNMFPKNGNDVPEWRFPQFTDSWEQRKLGDLLQTLPFKQFLKEPEPDGKYEIIQQGNEPVIGFANGTPCGDYKDVVIFGDHTLSLYKPQHPFFVATDGVRIVKGQQDTDGYYLLSLLERYKPQSEGYKRYYIILADTNCITTYNPSEQEKIAVFFKLLDNLITLHQHKLEEMKKYKKSLMQLLLTGIVRVQA